MTPTSAVNIRLEEGTHIIRVETSANAAGNTGFDEVAVTLEKRAIPIDLEGADPPPPPTPVTETRGLWHFDTATAVGGGGAPPSAPFDPDWATTLLLHLDECECAADSSGYSNHGTLYGYPATLQPGRFGSCITFDGMDDYVEVPYGYNLDLGASDFTLEAWVMPQDYMMWSRQTILTKSTGWGGYTLRLENGYLVLKYFADYGYGYPVENSIWGMVYIPTWQWTHVAAVRAGGTVTLYVNGVADGTGMIGAGTALYPSCTPFRIGALDPWMSWDCFRGSIDEVRVSTTARFPPPALATPDASGHGNHAGLLGGASIEWISTLCLPNGYNEYAATPADQALALGAADFTIDLYIQPAWQTYLCALTGPGYNVAIDGDGRAICQLYGALGSTAYACLTSTATLSPGNWGLLSLRRTADTVTLFVNGYEDASVTFHGSLTASAGPVTFGPFYPVWYNVPYWDWYYNDYVDCWYCGTGPVYIGEVQITTTTMPSISSDCLHASIYIPADFDLEVADRIHYFHGLRDATAADPAFSEAETEPSSLLFRGTFQDVATTIAIDPVTFAGLTPNMDSLDATVVHTCCDGSIMTVRATLTETQAESNLFRAVHASGANPGTDLVWAVNTDWGQRSVRGEFTPMTVRVRGLSDYRIDDWRLRLGDIGKPGAEFRFEQHGPHDCWYLRGRSVDFAVWVGDKERKSHGAMVYYSFDGNEVCPEEGERAKVKQGKITVNGEEVATRDLPVLHVDIEKVFLYQDPNRVPGYAYADPASSAQALEAEAPERVVTGRFKTGRIGSGQNRPVQVGEAVHH